jgi:aminoglycoside/choline kinase family phosphotransferase
MDFHVENLMVYHNKIYVIDFQDAYLTWPAYDLVSLLQDARYELPEAIANKLFYDYCKIIKINPIIMFSDYNIIGAQRNCRILGVFARKYIKDKNSNYLKLIPLVLKYLKENLNAIESLKPIKSWMITKGVL